MSIGTLLLLMRIFSGDTPEEVETSVNAWLTTQPSTQEGGPCVYAGGKYLVTIYYWEKGRS